MAIKITENIKQGQINGGNRLNFVFINGISVNENENFVSTLNNDINDIDTEIEIKGLHSYTGYAVIENEVVNVTNYVLNTNTTTLTVERGLFLTIKSTHNINSKFYPVTYLDTLSEYTYEQKSDVSDSSLLSISLDTGTITLLDEPLNWATYNPNKKYDYKDYQKIFIFEGVNNEVVKTFEGVTSKKYDYKTSKKIKIEFKSSIYKEWKNGLNKSKMFYDNTIEEVLNYLYPDYKVEYLNGTDKNKLIKIKNMDLKNYTTHNNFLNALCRDRLIRLRFTTDNRILIVSDLYVSDLITDKDVYLDVVSIDDSSTDLVFNKITGTYRETSEYRNNEEYKRKYQDNEIDSSEDVKYVQFYKYKYFNTPLDVIKDYEFQTVNIDNIDTSILTYGDYVLLKAVDTGDVFNKDGIEIWGYVVDINNTTATITLGTSKVSWLNQRGYIDTIATNGDLTISNYRVYYGFYEMNIVNKYTISTTDGESKDYQMNLPVLPFVFYNNSTFLTQTIDENDEYCYVDGDWENIENYAKIGDEWVYLSGTYFDGTKTQCSITRGEFDTTPASHNTNDVVEVLKYNNMLINNNQFSFANLGDVKFSGLVSQIDGIWDIWFDNTQLKYNMEFTQDIPIYLYSNTITDNNNVIKYTGFDNHGISLKFERGNGENDFKVLIKNTLTTFKESELLTGVPINKLSSIIEVNKSLGEQIKAGDVLMLKEIKYGEPNYANYLSYKNVKWTVNTVEYNSTNDTYYLYLNNSFGSINDGVEFVVYPNSSIVMLQELYIRGNPVMYVEKNISLNTPESMERYGEKPYVITSTSHSETDIRLLIDYFKNGYKGLSPKNTRFKINTNVFGRYDIEVLDVVRITDTIYSNLNNQLAICINKKVSTNSVGIRQETLSFLTVGDYNVNPSNIELETTLTYTTNKIPYYNHVGSEINTDNSSDVKDDSIINLIDENTGNSYVLKKIDKIYMSALVNNDFIPKNNAGGIIELKDLHGLDLNTTANGSDLVITVVGKNLTTTLSQGDYIEIGNDYKKIKNIYLSGSNTIIELYDSLSQSYTNEKIYKNNYKKTVLNNNFDSFISINGEMLKVSPTTYTELTINQRGMFKTQIQDIYKDTEVIFYTIIAATTSYTQIMTDFMVGDGVDNILKFNQDEGFVLKTDNSVEITSGEQYIKVDKQNGVSINGSVSITSGVGYSNLADKPTSLSDINSSEVNSINTNINTAQSTANTAQSTADTALTTANTAITTANTAQSTADSKNTIFRLPSNQTPQNQKIGDIWVKTDEEINNVFSWDGSAWIPTATNNSEKFKYGTIVNIGKDAVGSGKDGFSVTTGGFVNVENLYNKMYFEPTGESSYFMINVSQSEIANNNGSVKWQIGSVNDDSYIKYWFDSTENKDKLKISVDEFQLQGNNILRGLSFYYLVKDDTLPSGTSNSNMIEYEGVLVYATPYRFGAFNFVRSNKTIGTNTSIQLKYVEHYTVLKFIKNSNGNLFALIYNSTNYNLKLIKINSVYDNSTTNITELKDFGNTPIFTNKFTRCSIINNGNDLYFYVTDSNFNCVLYKFDTNNNTYISKNLNVEAVKILNFKNKIYLLTFGYLYRIDSSLNTEIITSNSPINIATTNNYLFLIYDFDIYYSGTGDSNSFTKLKELENNSFYYGYNSASYNLKTYIPISNGYALVVDDSLNAEEIFIQEKNFSFYSCSFGLFFIYEYNNLAQYGIGDVVSYNLTTKL